MPLRGALVVAVARAPGSRTQSVEREWRCDSTLILVRQSSDQAGDEQLGEVTCGVLQQELLGRRQRGSVSGDDVGRGEMRARVHQLSPQESSTALHVLVIRPLVTSEVVSFCLGMAFMEDSRFAARDDGPVVALVLSESGIEAVRGDLPE